MVNGILLLELFSKTVVTINMSWSECIICRATEKAFWYQKNRKNFDALSVYGEFFENISKLENAIKVYLEVSLKKWQKVENNDQSLRRSKREKLSVKHRKL